MFDRMMNELKSDYVYKYNAAKMMVEAILHIVMKSASFQIEKIHRQSASERIIIRFLELLERQFPIEQSQQRLILVAASDFADQLNVHVNHLTKSIKEVTEKTTTNIIKERIMQEAQTLIQLTDWRFLEIAFAQGYKEVTHFNNFFRKSTGHSPSKFWNAISR